MYQKGGKSKQRYFMDMSFLEINFCRSNESSCSETGLMLLKSTSALPGIHRKQCFLPRQQNYFKIITLTQQHH